MALSQLFSRHRNSIPLVSASAETVRFLRPSAARIRLKQCLICAMLVVALLRVFGFLSTHSRSSKYVIVLSSNTGGGVMGWKGPQEWQIEKESIQNKKQYAKRHGIGPILQLCLMLSAPGYDLVVRDMKTQKRYQHEWRESWEKVDAIQATMKQFPKAEWFWWLDLNTIIMEPQISLESHIFDHLGEVATQAPPHNPLGLQLSPLTNRSGEINMLVTQDCSGFSLGSFFIRRSEWTEWLLDVWWNPVFYEQMHARWEHNEQDALQHMYVEMPHVQDSLYFLPQRTINSFPSGACSDYWGDKRFFYFENERDFLVNMAGCEYGRNCFEEMRVYRELSRKHHKWWKFR
ncbi:putative alpha-1,6-mannosyltransferase MNN10 [Neolecta irregularis DAH-3]|uniref:Putative alpha-1,6-mannosyltransferase MNN10 n=1 Tax=Neolecta irregularis (strain DAH-3) TaxID=1198029 RepID=A0A1U7LPE3_NEOID|nr:putative alpha-1,6-mannosyltransferase MNN10 [Neolecta irregularis DAH-3]|eukprot:OLL24536.1 putative alpha-1,6-mannosyltransferase MNN10 [Neolecta irregularis DAH-3]